MRHQQTQCKIHNCSYCCWPLGTTEDPVLTSILQLWPLAPWDISRPTDTTSNTTVNNNDRRLSCKYIEKPCTYYANDVSISLFHDAIHVYSASVRHNSSLPFVLLCSPYVTTWSWVTASIFAFTLPYNRLPWPRIGFLCARVKQKLREFHETCLRKMVWFHHSYSTFCSFLCTATWLRKWRQELNVMWKKLPYGVDSWKIFTVQDVRGLLRF
jgi:hypothetical protein